MNRHRILQRDFNRVRKLLAAAKGELERKQAQDESIKQVKAKMRQLKKEYDCADREFRKVKVQHEKAENEAVGYKHANKELQRVVGKKMEEIEILKGRLDERRQQSEARK